MCGVTIESPIESPNGKFQIPNSSGSRVQDRPYQGYLYPPKTNYITRFHNLVRQDYNQTFEVDEQHNTYTTTPEKKHFKSDEVDSPDKSDEVDSPDVTYLSEFLRTPPQGES